jgi:beta-lysine 5,6-aminomutase beta subunit
MTEHPEASGGRPPGPAQIVRPYGDTTGDGRIQVSFTLPVPFATPSERARAEGAAAQLAAKMGLEPAMVVHAKGMGPDYTFFIVYGRVSHLVDLSQVEVAEREFPLLSPAEVNLRIRSGLGRKLVVVGACIGTDAHTVGIDAILNVKGHAGEKGLEYYREIRVVNLGSQVAVPDLVAAARAEGADAVLVSQVVTQRDAHISNAREMSTAFDAAAGESDGRRPLLVVGGPRFDPAMAGELGVDKIFGKGTTPGEVASYLAYALTPDDDAEADADADGEAGGAAAGGGAAGGSDASADAAVGAGAAGAGATGVAA